MQGLKSLLPLAFLAANVLASPTPAILEKHRDPIVCAHASFLDDAITGARVKGCELFKAGETLGKNEYPHRFYNREGFDFLIPGPYQEYPIMESAEIYDGGKPGPHRVVFDEDCGFGGLITHIGASGGGFLACVDDSPVASNLTLAV